MFFMRQNFSFAINVMSLKLLKTNDRAFANQSEENQFLPSENKYIFVNFFHNWRSLDKVKEKCA